MDHGLNPPPHRQRRPLLTGLFRLGALALACAVLTVVLVTAHALWLDSRDTLPYPAAVIVVLGGGVLSDGTPGPDTLRRTRHGIALWQAGLAPRLHFTGGHKNPTLPGLGSAMADVALAEGVPAAVISTEDVSRSTLQNALLSAEVVPPAVSGPVLLVSDGYHLGRAWASFRWAGYGDVHVSAASAFGGGTMRDQARRIGRESLAWWYNVARMGAWSLLDLFGVERERTLEMLADAGPRQAAAA